MPSKPAEFYGLDQCFLKEALVSSPMKFCKSLMPHILGALCREWLLPSQKVQITMQITMQKTNASNLETWRCQKLLDLIRGPLRRD